MEKYRNFSVAGLKGTTNRIETIISTARPLQQILCAFKPTRDVYVKYMSLQINLCEEHDQYKNINWLIYLSPANNKQIRKV